MKEIALTKGLIAFVDESDFDLLNSFSWHASKSSGNLYYAARKNSLGKTEYMHRILMGNPTVLKVDHINQNTLDNRRSNLRLVNTSFNALNTAKAKGVTQLPNGSFRAQLMVKGVRYAKCFSTHNEAEEFYIFTKQKLMLL